MTVRGFESAREQVDIDYGDHRLIGFVGANGAGKSLLAVWAPYWLLFDKVRTRTKEEAIAAGCTHAFGRLIFEHGGTVYRIERKLPRTGRSEATLSTLQVGGVVPDGPWDAPSTSLTKDANARIVELLGMDADVAEHTFIAPQGRYGAFSGSSPADRRRILTAILRLDQYGQKLEVVKDRLKIVAAEQVRVGAQLAGIDVQLGRLDEGNTFPDLDNEHLTEHLTGLLATVATFDAQMAELDTTTQLAQIRLERARDAMDRHHQEQETIRAQLSEQVQRLLLAGQNSRKAFDDAQTRRDVVASAAHELQARSRQLDTEKAVLATARGELSDAQTREQQLRLHDAGLAQQIQVAAAASSDAQDRIDGLTRANSAHCFTCSQPLPPALLESLLTDQREQFTALTVRSDELSAQSQASATELARMAGRLERCHQEVLRGQEQLAATGETIAVQRHLTDTEPEVRAACERHSAELVAARREHADARGALAAFTPAPVSDDLTQALARAEGDADVEATAARRAGMLALAPDRSAISLAEREIGRREAAAARSELLETERAAAGVNQVSITAELSDLAALRSAFGPTGAPAMILAGGVQEIEEVANRYLTGLSRGAMSLSITTQRQGQKGGVSEEIFLQVNTPTRVLDYRSLSGGQQFRVDLAMRIALTQVTAARSGAAQVQTLVVDEGWGLLDADGIVTATAALTELSGEFTVITVSHIDAVKSGLPAVVEVSLDTGTTTAAAMP